MKIKTTNLTGKALDWSVGVAISIGGTMEIENGVPGYSYTEVSDCGARKVFEPFEPTTNWGQLGAIIEMLGVGVSPVLWPHDNPVWIAAVGDNTGICTSGPTPLIAACRAIVAAKLGDTVDVPEVLL